MKSPLVSIIVPVYNRDNIRDTIDSILNQDYQNLEIIIVNDGSSRAVSMSLEGLIKEYNDCRIVYLCQENKGPSAARNLGLKYCRGTYVCFFDSDDIMLPTRISHQVHSMVKSESDFCAAGFHYKRRDIDIIPNPEAKDNTLHSFLLMRDNLFVGTQAWVFRRDLLMRINGYNEKMWTHEDCDLVFRYLTSGNLKLSVVPEILTIYCDDESDDRLTNLKKTADIRFLFGSITFYSNVVEYILHSHLMNKKEYLSIHYKRMLKIAACYRKDIKRNNLLDRVCFVKSCVKAYDCLFYYSNCIYYHFCQCYYILKNIYR